MITKKFLNNILMAFFCLVSPISKKENPKCIKNTSAVQIIIHTLLAVNSAVSIILNVIASAFRLCIYVVYLYIDYHDVWSTENVEHHLESACRRFVT